MTKLKPKPKSARPPNHAPHAFTAIKTAVASLQPTIPQPAPMPTTDAERDAVLARIAPAAPAKTGVTWRERAKARWQSECRLMKSDAKFLWGKIKHLGKLIVVSFQIVVFQALDAALYGIWVIVFGLVIYLGWMPCLRLTEALAGKVSDLAAKLL